jgi:hypothetical protein
MKRFIAIPAVLVQQGDQWKIAHYHFSPLILRRRDDNSYQTRNSIVMV